MPGLEFRYVEQDRLPARLSEFDVEHYFALSDSDVAALNERFRRDRRAGAAIQLVFLRASGHTLDHVGTLPRQLLRTLFLCDYFSNVAFRRELQMLLNRGESVHQLQRAIYTGRVASERGRRRDEMVAISGSLTLLTNLVIAWNTQRMQATVDGWRRKGRQVDDEWVRRMGPAHFAHVNFRGTLSFPVDRYGEILLEAASWQRDTGS
ncbi:Tn3 family transposase [Burkholderia lata]|uniref:Tn3 family transposase n=1 Tax=Burkholderia cepacia complex TaxID=87882 RepID=UPI000F0866CD|nr:hypothetical protein CVS37_36570 [Burkholderia lata]